MRVPWSVTPDELDGLLRGAGFEQVRVDVVEVPTDFPGPRAQAPERAVLAGPVAPAYQALSETDRAAFCDRVATALEPFEDGDRLRPPMYTIIATGRR